MPFTLSATTVRFIHREWELDGRSGVSHKLTVSDGDDLLTVRVPEDLLETLDSGTLECLGTVGYPVLIDLSPPRAYPNERGGNPRVDLRARAVRIVAAESAR